MDDNRSSDEEMKPAHSSKSIRGNKESSSSESGGETKPSTQNSEQAGCSQTSSTYRSRENISGNNVSSISDSRQNYEQAMFSTENIEQVDCSQTQSTSHSSENVGGKNDSSSSDSQLSDEGTANTGCAQTDCARARHFRKNYRGLDDNLPVSSPTDIADAIRERLGQEIATAKTNPQGTRRRCYNPCEPSDRRDLCPGCVQRYRMVLLNVTLKISDSELVGLTRRTDPKTMELLTKFSKRLRKMEEEENKRRQPADELRNRLDRISRSRIKNIPVGLFGVREPVADSVTNQAIDLAMDLTIDQATDQASNQVMDHVTDEASDQAMYQPMDHGTDESIDQEMKQLMYHPMDQASCEASNQFIYQDMDPVADPKPETDPNAVLNANSDPDADLNMDHDGDLEADK